MAISFIKKIKKGIARKYYGYLVERKVGTCKNLKVNHRCNVTRKTHLGENVNFNGMYISGRGNVNIGNNFHSGSDCRIMTDYHNYDAGGKIPYDDTYIVRDVVIEDNVWFGYHVTVLPGVIIGEGAIIQAGSVVVCDIPPLAIAGGHPAKVFKYRDKKHYEELKKEGLFH